MSKSWEKRYLEDILPEIEKYAGGREVIEIKSSEISSELEKYTPQKVGKALKYVSRDRKLEAIKITDNDPKKWRITVPEANSLEELSKELEPANDSKDKEINEQSKNEEPENNRFGLGEQEYGKLRKNIDQVYRGLKEIKDERSGYFDSRHIGRKVDEIRNTEIGIVLSSLSSRDFIETYSDRQGYFPDSIDLDGIQRFKRSLKEPKQ